MNIEIRFYHGLSKYLLSGTEDTAVAWKSIGATAGQVLDNIGVPLQNSSLVGEGSQEGSVLEQCLAHSFRWGWMIHVNPVKAGTMKPDLRLQRPSFTGRNSWGWRRRFYK
jgi:hypothetical protein